MTQAFPLVLVSGANGFVGRALCPRLREAWNVRKAYRVLNRVHGDDSVAIGDIGGGTDWRAALSGCSAVVHLAARAHVMCDVEPDSLERYRSVNTAGTINLARQAAEAGVRRFVFVSTVKVQGEGREIPYAESDRPAPQDSYAISKWEAEQGLREIASSTGLEVVILRSPLVYGPGVSANFYRLLRAVDCGLPFPFGALNNRRSLIYTGNLSDAIAAGLTHPAAAQKTFLVSDRQDVSTPELIDALAAAMRRPARLLPVPVELLKAVGAMLGKRKEIDRLTGSLAVDSGLIGRELGWNPPCSLQQGLAETVAWYKNQTISPE
ncbi:MAG: SDR family oxidoreductase [Alphaproteobacteria bacterium]